MEGSSNMIALVLGATGGVGKELVKQLVSHPAFTRVRIIGRRPLEDVTSDKIDFLQVNFDDLDQHTQAFDDAQIVLYVTGDLSHIAPKVAFCCLGTTRGKAGKEGFIKVDRDYVVNSAKILKEKGCSHFHLVTSIGSDKNSMMLYSKTKGEAEEAVGELQFSRLSIYQPGLLMCERQELRIVESVAQAMAKAFDWRNRLSVHVETVAKAMITNTLCPPSGEGVQGAQPAPFTEKITHSDILRLGTD